MMKFSLVTLLVADLNVMPTRLTIIMSLHKRHAAFVEEETYTLENLQKAVKVTVASLVVASLVAASLVVASLVAASLVAAHPALERVVKAGVCRCDDFVDHLREFKHDETYFRQMKNSHTICILIKYDTT